MACRKRTECIENCKSSNFQTGPVPRLSLKMTVRMLMFETQHFLRELKKSTISSLLPCNLTAKVSFMPKSANSSPETNKQMNMIDKQTKFFFLFSFLKIYSFQRRGTNNLGSVFLQRRPNQYFVKRGTGCLKTSAFLLHVHP